MIIKIVFITLSLLSFAFASYQKVYIGKIDPFYEQKITKDELLNIIKEIEQLFESQLGENIFDYSKDGKPINLIYLPPSQLEQDIDKQIKMLKSRQKKIEEYQNYFPKRKTEIENLKKSYESKNNILNKKIKSFNQYVDEINTKKNLSLTQYKKATTKVEDEKVNLNKEITKLNKDQRHLKTLINRYNQKVIRYNNLLKSYQRLSRKLERMNKSFKQVKGKTFGLKEIRLKSSYKNGKLVKQKDIKVKMNKIEIYGFKDINELKAILAHEIAHLVGVHHINNKGALMNPIIQSNQLEELSLTNADIEAFRKYF